VTVGKFGPAAPFHTTNLYLNFLVGDPAGSEHLLKALAALPEKEPVAVIFREANDSDTLLAYLVAYFAWPRPIKSLPIDRDNAGSQMQALRATPLSAAFFCGVKPPPHIQSIVRIGDGLAMARRLASKNGMP
jgi:hypothetical protein